MEVFYGQPLIQLYKAIKKALIIKMATVSRRHAPPSHVHTLPHERS